MEKVAADIYSFRKLRENGFTYVETAMLLPLCDLSIGTQFFIARPRRFGKSLLGHLSKPDVTQFRDLLKEFYSVIKTPEAQEHFTAAMQRTKGHPLVFILPNGNACTR